MELIAELLKISIPAALVLYGMFLTVRSFLRKDFEKKLLEVQSKKIDIVLPLKLQAYERMALFLERITPNQLITRLNDNSYTVEDLRIVLISEIRQELNYNFSQQIYMSHEAWVAVKAASESIFSLINESAAGLEKTAPGFELVRKIFETVMAQNDDFTSQALIFLKNEARALL